MTAEEVPASTPGSGPTRRRVLRTAAVGGAAAFAAPVIQSVTVPAAAASHISDGEGDPGAVVSGPSGLQVWLRADAGITTDSSGGVSAWEDQAGGDHDASQGNADLRPRLEPNTVNGLPAVVFDGANDFLLVPYDINPTVNPDLTIFSVFATHVGDFSLRKLYSHDNTSFDRDVGLDSRAGAPNNYTYFTGAGVAPYFPLAADTPVLTTDQWTPDTFNGWRNGSQAVTNGALTHGDPGDDGGWPFLHLGNNPSHHHYWDGWLAEFIVYNRILAAAERELIESYLLTKYAIS